MIKLLFVVICSFGIPLQDGFSNNTQTGASTEGCDSKATLASSQGPHSVDTSVHRSLHQALGKTSFSRPPASCTSSTYPLPISSSNGGVMEMQKVLEGAQWKALPLSPLRWTLGPCAGRFVPATRAERTRPTAIPRSRKVPACEKCSMEWKPESPAIPGRERPQWISKRPQTKAKEQKNNRTANYLNMQRLRCLLHGTSLEASPRKSQVLQRLAR